MISDYSFSVVIERLKQALNVASERALAIEIGLKPAAYYNRKKLESLPMTEIVSTCLARGISIDWVFTGAGNAFKNGEQIESEPVAAVDPNLLGRIVMELERAFTEGDLDAKAKMEHAAKLGLLATGIYNNVAFLKSEKQQRSAIRAAAEGFAHAAELLDGQRSINEHD